MTPRTETIKTALVHPSPTNPRKSFDAVKLQELVESVEQHGVLQPILVRSTQPAGYEVVAGERRLRAAQQAKLELIPAVVRDDLSDAEVLELQMTENLQRAELTALEEAQGYAAMLALQDKAGQPVYTPALLAQRLSRTPRHVARLLSLNKLPPAVAAHVDAGDLAPMTACLIARLPNDALRAEVTEEVLKPQFQETPLSYRETEEMIKEDYMISLKGACFDLKADKLLPAAGSCQACPKRTGNDKEAFEGYHGNTCTDTGCYRDKQDAHWAALEVEVAAGDAPVKLVSGAAAEKLLPYNDIRLGYNSKMVLLTDKPPAHLLKPDVDYAKVPKFKALLKDTGCQLVVVRGPNTGKAIEMAEGRLALEAAREARPDLFRTDKGKHQSSGAFYDDDAAKKQKAKERDREKLKLATSLQCMDALQEEMVRQGQPAAFWGTLAQLADEAASADAKWLLCKRQGLDVKGYKQKGSYSPESDAVAEYLRELPEEQLPGFVVELLTGGTLKWAGALGVAGQRHPKPFFELYGVDAKAIEKALATAQQAEAEAKAKAAKKAAKKKVAKKVAKKTAKPAPAAKKKMTKQATKKTAKRVAKKATKTATAKAS